LKRQYYTLDRLLRPEFLISSTHMSGFEPECKRYIDCYDTQQFCPIMLIYSGAPSMCYWFACGYFNIDWTDDTTHQMYYPSHTDRNEVPIRMNLMAIAQIMIETLVGTVYRIS
jgi:hypothetical protein